MNYTDNVFYKLVNFIQLRRKKVKYGKNLNINGILHIHGPKESIIIGDNVTITSSEDINPSSGFNYTHLRVIDNGKIIIGNNVGISNACITSHGEGIRIGDNVLIGSGVKIIDTDFHSIDYHKRMMPSDTGKTKSIDIDEGAFIGMCSIILKGTKIGCHSVIGAGSVVKCSIPEYELWSGNPVRKIRNLSK